MFSSLKWVCKCLLGHGRAGNTVHKESTSASCGADTQDMAVLNINTVAPNTFA